MESTCSSNHTALYKVVASHTNSLIKPISTHLTSKPSAIGDTIGTGFENYLDRCLELHLRSGPMVFGFQNELLVATRCGDCEMCEPNCELYVCMHVSTQLCYFILSISCWSVWFLNLSIVWIVCCHRLMSVIIFLLYKIMSSCTKNMWQHVKKIIFNNNKAETIPCINSWHKKPLIGFRDKMVFSWVT